jgi:branched-chain amino acid transport system ATP-binding protein
MLEISKLNFAYGDLKVLWDVDLRVERGEIVTVVGANGAGKSTLLKTIAGVMQPTAGQVEFDGRDMARVADHQRVALGISLVPEGRRIFKSLTVQENLQVGAYSKRPGPWDLAAVFEAFPLLADRRNHIGAHLSGGEQQATAIGRALMANPRLMLLDEVSLGLAPVVVGDIYRALPKIAAKGTTVLVVEQDLSQALSIADRLQCVLEGRTVLEAPAADLTHEEVATAYFGLKESP